MQLQQAATFHAAAGPAVTTVDALGVAIAGVVFVVALAVISARLLGVHLARGWSLLASILGSAVGVAGAEEVDPDHLGRAVLLTALFAVLATMTFVVIIEALLSPRRPAGHRRRGTHPLVHPLRWCSTRLSPIGRSWEVLRHARQRGLARVQFISSQGVTSAEFGRRLRLTLEDSGGMFVKFGQIASTRTDLLGEAVTSELASLRASVRPIPADQLRPLLEGELGEPVEAVFASVDWEPMAAASIGQTHRARFHDGRRMVLKIQRPGMEELMQRDATVLRLVTSVAERRLPGARSLGLKDLCEELITGLGRELDYTREAAMSERLADHTGPEVKVPGVDHAHSTRRLLVMEEAVGRSVDDPDALRSSAVPPATLAQRLLSSFLEQVLEEGVYHADPHPGNVLVDSQGILWLLDFGSVGLLDPGSRQSLQEMTFGMTIGEPIVVARAMRSLAGDISDADLRQLQAEIGLLMVEVGSGGFDPTMLRRVLSVMRRHGMTVPPSMTLLSRALLTLDGTLQTISPGFDLQREATGIMRQLHDVDAAEPSSDLLRSELLRALPMLRTLPEHADELATQLRAGRLSLRTERYAGRDERIVQSWVDRTLLALVGVGGALTSALLLLGAAQSTSRDVGDALRAIGFTGLVLSAVLLLRSVAQVFQRERRRPG